MFSHLINLNYLKKNKDYIYGDIFRFFKKDISFIYLNHLKSHSKLNIKEKLPKFIYDYYILNNDYISIKNFLNIIFNCLIEREKLLNLAKKSKNKKKKKFFILAADFAFSSSSITNLIYYYSIHNIIKNCKPKNIITTFEGHSFERLIFFAAYKNNIKINRIGYQSAFILKNQNSMFLKLNKNFMPDQIWLSGKIYNKKFSKIFSNNTKIKILGSVRRLKKNIKKKIFIKQNTCLVIPEGFYDATSDLMKFCFKYSQKYYNIKFIFRIHPELNLDIFFKRYPELKFYKKYNIIISKNFDPIDDYRKCNFCIYRQTTMVSQAIIFSLKPFYLVDKKNISVDSIYLIKKWKEYIHSTSDLMHKINKFNKQKNKYKYLKNAQNLCNKFYTDINYKLIKKLHN